MDVKYLNTIMIGSNENIMLKFMFFLDRCSILTALADGGEAWRGKGFRSSKSEPDMQGHEVIFGTHP